MLKTKIRTVGARRSVEQPGGEVDDHRTGTVVDHETHRYRDPPSSSDRSLAGLARTERTRPSSLPSTERTTAPTSS